MDKTVLVVAAHSDDEALGCAGSMAKHVASGDNVHVLFMTDGVGSRYAEADGVVQRQSTSQTAAEDLQLLSIQNLDFPDNKMDAVPLLDITQAIEKVVSEIQPDIIYTHHIGDLNIDHQITHKAVMTACRPQPKFCVNEIYAFEVLSSTEWQTVGWSPFIPNVFVDISGYIETKRAVLKIYCDEMREEPHSRSIDNAINLAKVRGSSVGLKYAEAFVSLRELR